MCGIVGVVFADPLRPPSPATEAALARAVDVMSHRGPDGEGRVSATGMAFGHRRLSIIDLASGGQPMRYQQGRYVITFNGEIYNYRQLRDTLLGLGHEFATASDTEVVLAAYAQWGEAMPARLRGIFAFAIWDSVDRRAFLARDHLGVKPLLYLERAGESLAFGSDLKSLLVLGGDRLGIDPEALSDYLAAGYPQSNRTIVREVRRLEPAQFLVYERGRARIGSYWDLAECYRAPRIQGRLPELALAFEEKFADSVRAQMVSDVPVGAFLSGGLDSSSVVAQMRRRQPGELFTFSMGFAEKTFSELDHAREVAHHFGTRHVEDVASPDPVDWADFAWRIGEPLGDTSLIPTFLVSGLARQHVKVVLSGDGADECLAGYDTYVADKLHGAYRWVPSLLHRHLITPLAALLPHSGQKVGLDYKIRQFVRFGQAAFPRAHFGWRELFDAEERLQLGTEPAHAPWAHVEATMGELAGASRLDQTLYSDTKTWLANDILTKVDRATMAVGLEARVPFLDPDLVEFCARLPVEAKMKGFSRKRVLRTTATKDLPKSILERPKSGFNAPVSRWLRGSLGGTLEDLVGRTKLIDGRSPRLRQLIQEHGSGLRDHGFKLWSLTALLLWEREVWDRTAGTTAVGGA
ncbi:MAG: asparagine synthase (glutamine-hydrolyzing) [Vicinamibacteria bacterium]|nr:asparagine synthase (glutamine-hydrolyzing) [Vicinamibacteria bacterium]